MTARRPSQHTGVGPIAGEVRCSCGRVFEGYTADGLLVPVAVREDDQARCDACEAKRQGGKAEGGHDRRTA